MLGQQNHAAGGGNDSILVGMFVVCLCLASQKPSEQEFVVPARTDLGVKLLTALPIRVLAGMKNSRPVAFLR